MVFTQRGFQSGQYIAKEYGEDFSFVEMTANKVHTLVPMTFSNGLNSFPMALQPCFLYDQVS